MKTILLAVNDYWLLITIVAALLPTPINRLKSWVLRVIGQLPRPIEDILLKVKWDDAEKVINCLADPNQKRVAAVSMLITLTRQSEHPLDYETADKAVKTIERVYASAIAKLRAGR